MSEITTEINIAPKTDVYAVFRKLNYEQASAYSEFIDNSTQSFFDHREELMADPDFSGCVIEINHDPVNGIITVKDNCFGMELEDFKRAVILNSKPSQRSRNEYGMGLKTAATWFGSRWTVCTTRMGSDAEYTTTIDVDELERYAPEKIPAHVRTVPRNTHYTVITIEKLNKDCPQKKSLNALRQALGKAYCRDIQNDLVTIMYNDEIVEYERPNYLETLDENGRKKVWKQQLDFNVEYKSRSYHVSGFVAIRDKGSQKHAGFILFRNNRAVFGGFRETYKPVEIFELGNSFQSQRLYGEFDLDDWPVVQTKDKFDWEGELESLFIYGVKERISEIIEQCKNYRVPKKPTETGKPKNTPSGHQRPNEEHPTTSPVKGRDESGEETSAASSKDTGGDSTQSGVKIIPAEVGFSIESSEAEKKVSNTDSSSYTYRVKCGEDWYSFSVSRREFPSESLFAKSTKGNEFKITINIGHPLVVKYDSIDKSIIVEFVIYLALSEKMVELDTLSDSISASSIRESLNKVSYCPIERVYE